MENNSAIKVIHIVESLHRGAVENWLIRMFSFAKDKGISLDWTFYCIEKFPGDKESIVTELGGKLIKSEFNWSRPIELMKSLRKHLVDEKYEVIHCHHDFMSALYLMSTIGLKNKKFVHIHNMDEHIPTKSRFKSAILKFFFRRICWYFSDKMIGISNHTLDRFILNQKRNPSKHILHYYGVNASKFLNSERNKELFCKQFEIPEKSKIFLFLGRLAPVKNPLFAIRVFSEMLKQQENLFALFVGEGNLKSDLLSLAVKLGVGDKFKFIGWSNEVEWIMKNSDLFVLPHVEYPIEGLGLVILEAQLSGLPILISKGISEDPLLASSKFARLSLNDDVSIWAKKGIKLINEDNSTYTNVLNEFNKSDFELNTALSNLIKIYNE